MLHCAKIRFRKLGLHFIGEGGGVFMVAEIGGGGGSWLLGLTHGYYLCRCKGEIRNNTSIIHLYVPHTDICIHMIIRIIFMYLVYLNKD